MPKPMIRIHDVETGEVIDREMTANEIKDHETNVAAIQALKDANALKATAKEALLERLGITEAEAQLLLA